ncbi:MAG: substrate-binding domain-containing protein [Oscillospiraceae bacterium]
MKKIATIFISTLVVCIALVGCGEKGKANSSISAENSGSIFDTKNDITVISREDGSGTRGAFTDIFKITEKNAEGKNVDMTVETADITQSTGVMLTSVEGNQYAVGYISLGSLNDTVKAVKIDGVEATAENVKNSSYKISRPFNIATKGDINEATQDFINFIISSEGQKIVEETGYISKENKGEFVSTNPQGKITITGSSSVAPVIEKLKEAYEEINSKVAIELSQTDSTNGMNSVADGICDIGMASREIKDSELEKGLKSTVIAVDGIAVIVNKNNSFDELSTEQVKNIYMGDIIVWSELIKE